MVESLSDDQLLRVLGAARFLEPRGK